MNRGSTVAAIVAIERSCLPRRGRRKREPTREAFSRVTTRRAGIAVPRPVLPGFPTAPGAVGGTSWPSCPPRTGRIERLQRR